MPTTCTAPAIVEFAAESALTEFQATQLTEQLRRHFPSVSAVSARYVVVVALTESVDAETLSRLRQVLTNNSKENTLLTDANIDIGPRAGTISPWSSKATDIVHRCGLTVVDRVERVTRYWIDGLEASQLEAALPILMDRMTEAAYRSETSGERLFDEAEPRPLASIALADAPLEALEQANVAMGLALSSDELEYLAAHYTEVGRNPTDAELMMFAQANSEHCRHKIFNASWRIDGQSMEHSLFGMIRHTSSVSPDGILSAYSDNAAVLAGPRASRLMIDDTGHWQSQLEPVDIAIKVETHNHPTAISPHPGAATGAGGEIRDEGATGLGAQPKAGVCGFSVSDLNIPGWTQPWEADIGKQDRIVSGLDIMLEGPIGAAAFNNEFGRPNIGGYFRTFLADREDTRFWGYHKPIMIAGGLGNVRREHAVKQEVPADALVVVLGGPGMLIGLGGGAASSMTSGASDADLDFASVQRGNPEMQRRAQEVINACWRRGESSPILLIHDVGAGGLSNAIPEAVDHSSLGGRFDLRSILTDESQMSPMEIWCNESQERYVLVIAQESEAEFGEICARERCPFAVVGSLTSDRQLIVEDPLLEGVPVDLPMDVLLGKTPQMSRDVARIERPVTPFDTTDVRLEDAWRRVLAIPSVADKSFLIHIGDRTVGGLVSRDQLVGRWQVPVSDVAVTLSTHSDHCGEAMAMGERTPVACENPGAAARLAVVESLTNILAADVARLSDIKLSANWMAAAGQPGQDAGLYDAVQAIGQVLCPALGIAIPVGKDSLSMHTQWSSERGEEHSVTAPVSLIVTAFAPVGDVRKTLTPELQPVDGSALIFVDLSEDPEALGRSALAQAWRQQGGRCADAAPAATLKSLLEALIDVRKSGQALAWHDRADGGLLATFAEMIFASRLGVDATLPDDSVNDLAWLFSEGPGVVIQVAESHLAQVHARFAVAGAGARCMTLAHVTDTARLVVRRRGETLLDVPRRDLQLCWSEMSFRMQALRDHPTCAAEAYERVADDSDPGLVVHWPDSSRRTAAVSTTRPTVAVLREQGVNSQHEMAAAFIAAGFDAVDVHMSDIEQGRVSLASFQAMAACGGFSFGDVLGAGGGWARSILEVPALRDAFSAWFERADVLTLGVCNGCQMLSQLTSLIPGTQHWPAFVHNRSAQFEARLSQVRINTLDSPWFDGMAGLQVPVVVSHGEGRARFDHDDSAHAALNAGVVAAQYVEGDGRIATRYPANPNGSAQGIAMLNSDDGRVAISMPHPERTLRAAQHSWHPADWAEYGPWFQLFENAKRALS
ncbi:MAG: phosphoribosylformylglycinamidine synthase [Pseudomonadota bacterium]